MRKCENCIHGSKMVNCNNDIVMVQCGIYNCESFTILFNVCGEHQYIKGYSNERNYVLYDDKYLGEGYFVINEVNGEIKKFIKIYKINNNGFHYYYLRAFGIETREDYNSEFTNTEFVFRYAEDTDNGLYDLFLELARNIDGKIYSIDKHHDGKNNIWFSIGNHGIVRMIVSRDIYHSIKDPTDFIDINIGDNYTCCNYEVINKFYNMLSEITCSKANNNDIKRILKL
jgi:hypothetical protein